MAVRRRIKNPQKNKMADVEQFARKKAEREKKQAE